jgi:hypothetical protein
MAKLEFECLACEATESVESDLQDGDLIEADDHPIGWSMVEITKRNENDLLECFVMGALCRKCTEEATEIATVN